MNVYFLKLLQQERGGSQKLLLLFAPRPKACGMEVKMEKINIKDKLNTFSEYWSPKIVGDINETYVKLAKLKGEFVWHMHENEDEMFMVIKGRMVIKLRTEEIILNEGEIFIIPRGIEHMPVAEEEVHVMLFEPKTTLNTGNVKNEKTVEILEKI